MRCLSLSHSYRQTMLCNWKKKGPLLSDQVTFVYNNKIIQNSVILYFSGHTKLVNHILSVEYMLNRKQLLYYYYSAFMAMLLYNSSNYDWILENQSFDCILGDLALTELYTGWLGSGWTVYWVTLLWLNYILGDQALP